MEVWSRDRSAAFLRPGKRRNRQHHHAGLRRSLLLTVITSCGDSPQHAIALRPASFAPPIFQDVVRESVLNIPMRECAHLFLALWLTGDELQQFAVNRRIMRPATNLKITSHLVA